ncbi:MAG: hypothetical protein M9942_13475 [Microthrixaceae bacterium]|nr:hypothetical protein [Microthrixaceae bacterium]
MIVGDLLAKRLAELGVRTVFGESVVTSTDQPAVGHTPVGEADLAVLLADAAGRIGEVDGAGRLGAALLPDGVLHLSSRPGGTASPRTVSTPGELLDALVDPPGVLTPDTSAVHLDLDLSAPVDESVTASAERPRRPVYTLDPSLSGMRILAVVGPGLVRARGVDGLHSFSRAAAAGVVNTWGAKGVERWDSPWHFGTVGLQERDLELAGVGDADLLVVSGLDPAELAVEALSNPLVQEVHPGQLVALCAHWEDRPDPPDSRPALYDSLAGVVTPLYEDEGAPLSAPRAALHLSGALPEGSMALVDPGLAGFWVARTFPTSIPNSVCVPAEATAGEASGFASAAALVCRLERRQCLAVTDARGAEAPETAAVLAFAEHLGVPVALQVWRDEHAPTGSWSSAGDHLSLLSEHLDPHEVRVDDVPVRLGEVSAIEAVAGPVRAG